MVQGALALPQSGKPSPFGPARIPARIPATDGGSERAWAAASLPTTQGA